MIHHWKPIILDGKNIGYHAMPSIKLGYSYLPSFYWFFFLDMITLNMILLDFFFFCGTIHNSDHWLRMVLNLNPVLLSELLQSRAGLWCFTFLFCSVFFPPLSLKACRMLVSSHLAYHYQGSKPLEDDGLRFTGNFWITVLLNWDLHYTEIRNRLCEWSVWKAVEDVRAS